MAQSFTRQDCCGFSQEAVITWL